MEVKNGVYLHHKGNHYEVIGTAIHSETQEELVIYKALYVINGVEGMVFARPKTMWNETIQYQGQLVHRFSFVREDIYDGEI